MQLIKSAGLLVFALFLLGSSCRQTSPGTLFRKLSPGQTGVTFANLLTETEDWNIIEYLYFYNGGGVAAGDVNNDGLPDLYFTANQLPNRLYLNLGDLRFEDITEKAGAGGRGDWKTGVSMADVNGDGWLDIYVCQIGQYKNVKGRNELFINNRDGTFTEKAAEYGIDFRGFSQQGYFFDYDRDGDLDLYLLNHSIHAAENYGPSSGRFRRDSLAGDRLYRNDGNRFSDVSESAGIFGSRLGFGLSAALSDFDRNGCTDIYVANDFHENDYLYYNQCDGTFREALASSMGHTSTFTMGSDAADLDNDGWTDLLTLDMRPWDEPVRKRSVGADPFDIYELKRGYGYHYQYSRNMLQLNKGPVYGKEALFQETGQLAGIESTDWSWAVLSADFDLDGWNDLFISNGIWRRPNDLDYLRFISGKSIQERSTNLELAARMPSGLVPNRAFHNLRGVSFEEISGEWGLAETGSSQGAAYTDLDADGDLDLVINNLNAPASIYQNHGREQGKGSSLRIRLEGEKANTFGIGVRIVAWADSTSWTRELFPFRGWLSSVEPLVFIGAGKRAALDSVHVFWPDGRVERRKNVAVDEVLVLRQKDAVFTNPVNPAMPAPLLRPAHQLLRGGWTHREDPAIEFNRERLLLSALSREGPALAVGDADNDGTDDFFIGGAAGQTGSLWLSAGKEGWIPADDSFLQPARDREDTDAVFFDADGDGDLDLAVASGGYNFPDGSQGYEDRLYINDGTGRFVQGVHSLPPLLCNTSCLTPFDFDGDGDLDLFVGARALPGKYGFAPDSYLLENDGKGRFEDVTAKAAPFLKGFGLVTDAGWLEKEKKLALVGEWMPLTMVAWENGKPVTEQTKEKGWWKRVRAADLDGNGTTDILLANEGLNHPFHLKENERVELFLPDADRNGYPDPFVTYYCEGRRWLFHDLDELSRQWPNIRKRFTEYLPFSEASPEEVLEETGWEKAYRLEADFLSSAVCWDADPARPLVPLPPEAQAAPVWDFAIHDIDRDGLPDVFLAGNTFEKAPGIGRGDASFGLVLRQTSPRRFQPVDPLLSGFAAPGESRRLEVLGRPPDFLTAGKEQRCACDLEITSIKVTRHRLNKFLTLFPVI